MRLQMLAIGLCLYVSTPILAHPISSENLYSLNAFQQQTITGKVTNQNGEPLEGVTVTAKGTQVTAVTKADGSFSIELPPGTTSLLFTYVGLELQEINVKGK